MPVAAQSIESPHDAASSLFHWSLFGPLIVLAVEGGILTPQFEFTSGWMRTVAQPVLFNLVFFSIALFVLLAGEEWGRISRENAWRMPWTWPLINLASYGLDVLVDTETGNDVWIAAQSDLLRAGLAGPGDLCRGFGISDVRAAARRGYGWPGVGKKRSAPPSSDWLWRC